MRLFMMALLACFALPARCEEKDLKAFFQKNCSVCHGVDGTAKGPSGEKLKGKNLTNPRFQKHTRDDEMVDAILTGKWFGKAMPSFKDRITEADARRLVKEVIRPMVSETSK